MSVSKILDGMLCRINLPVSFIKLLFLNPCTIFCAGLLVMKNRSGDRSSTDSDRAKRMVDIAFKSLHSSSASMMMIHGRNSDPASCMTPRSGSITSFVSCLELNEYCRSGSLRIASDTCFSKAGLNDDSWYAMVGKMRLTLLHSELSLEQKNDAPSSFVPSKCRATVSAMVDLPVPAIPSSQKIRPSTFPFTCRISPVLRCEPSNQLYIRCKISVRVSLVQGTRLDP